MLNASPWGRKPSFHFVHSPLLLDASFLLYVPILFHDVCSLFTAAFVNTFNHRLELVQFSPTLNPATLTNTLILLKFNYALHYFVSHRVVRFRQWKAQKQSVMTNVSKSTRTILFIGGLYGLRNFFPSRLRCNNCPRRIWLHLFGCISAVKIGEKTCQIFGGSKRRKNLPNIWRFQTEKVNWRKQLRIHSVAEVNVCFKIYIIKFIKFVGRLLLLSKFLSFLRRAILKSDFVFSEII
jgi:hypothetical protein